MQSIETVQPHKASLKQASPHVGGNLLFYANKPVMPETSQTSKYHKKKARRLLIPCLNVTIDTKPALRGRLP